MDSMASHSREGSPVSNSLMGSGRRTSHTGKQGGLTGLGYGVGVAWRHLRPFIPFFLISSLVVALIYLLNSIVYGGPFTDPLFFVKFNQRWPRPDPSRDLSASLTLTADPDLDDFTGNGTI